MADSKTRLIHTNSNSSAYDTVVVKRNGWVVGINENGSTKHYPPHAVSQINGEVSYE